MSHADNGAARVVEFTKVLEHPFGISSNTTTTERSVLIEIDGSWGESAPSRIYGETISGTLEILRTSLPAPPPATEDPTSHIDALAAGPLRGRRAALAAVDMALWDRHARALGQPLWRLFGADPAEMPISSFTIGIDEIDVMVNKVVTVGARSPILKIKLGRHPERDAQIMREVRRAAPDKTLRVDANQGWSVADAQRLIPVLAELGVEFVEQPLRRGDFEGLRALKAFSPLPIYVDEDSHVAADVPRLAEVCHGINIKLMKTGGLTEARRMIASARAHGLGIMIGCMVETSVAITAAAQLAPFVDHVDLDGHVLITNDPFEGCGWDQGRLTLRDAPGMGLRLRPGAEL